MNQFSTLTELNQFSINIHELDRILFKAPKNSVCLCNNSVYEPNQFNNDFHISLTRHDNLFPLCLYQPILSVLSLLLCLANTLYYFIVNVPPVCLFERNFQRKRRGMQLDVRGRGRWKKPTPTISQVFSFFYSYPTPTIFLIFQNFIDLYPPTIYQFFPNFPFYFLNQFFSNSRIFSEMRIIHFKNNFLGFLWKKSLTH